MEWAIFLGFTFACIAWMGTTIRIVMHKRLDLVDWLVGTMGAFYGIGYAFIIWSTYSGMNSYWSRWIISYSTYFWAPPILSLIAVISVWTGAALARGSRKQFRESAELTLRDLVGIKRLAWGLLFLGIFFYYLYAMAYGGFVGLLHYSDLIRSGSFDVIGIENPFSFMQRLGGLAFFSSFLFYALILGKSMKGYSRLICFLGLAISVCFSFYVLYSWMGRVGIFTYFSVFPLAYMYHKNSHGYSIAIKLPMLVSVIAVGLPVLSSWMTPGKASNDVIEFYAKGLSFPAVSLFSAIDNNHFRFFFDLVVAPLYMLPSRIWSGLLGIVPASGINTELIFGYQKGEGGVTGSVPTDMITFGYMQMDVVGVVITGILVGAGLVWLERFMLRIPGGELRSVLYAYSALMVATLTVLYADPLNIIQRNIHFIIGTAALFILISRKRVTRGSMLRSVENKDIEGKYDG